MAIAVALAAALPGQASEPAPTPVQLRPATRSAHAQQAPMLAAAWAGARAVAVGAHGTVLLSDDRGASWRQASVVPTQLTLTGLSFANEREGWAVGHGGVVLHTQDGGERWQLQRSELSQDRPLFAVHFFDRDRGVAVGLWSLVLVTRDGGRHWQTQELAPPPGSQRADLNLFGLFAGPGGALYAAAEKGYVLHSADGGQSWDYLSTGYRGSFWSGLAMPDGVLLVGGLRGALYRSGDNGRSWNRIEHESKAAITAWAQTGERSCMAVGQDGLQLLSTDNGASYQAAPRQDRARLAAVLANSNQPALLFSGQGPLSPQP